MMGSIILFGHVNNGKSTIGGRILAANSTVYESFDIDIEKEKGTISNVACLPFCSTNKIIYQCCPWG